MYIPPGWKLLTIVCPASPGPGVPTSHTAMDEPPLESPNAADRKLNVPSWSVQVNT